MPYAACPVLFEAMYRKYYKSVYNYVYGKLRCREAAEDVTADVFVAVLENLGRFRCEDGGGLSSWIFSIARNMTTDYRRRASFSREESVRDVAVLPSVMSRANYGRLYAGTRESSYRKTPSDAMGWTEADNSLHEPENPVMERIMEKLSEEECALLELRYGLGLTNDEVAGIVDSNAKAVSHRYRRLLAKCRKLADEPQ